VALFNNQEKVAGIYVRVSTFDQAREGWSYEEQEDSLKRICENRGFQIYGIYGDPGISGKYLQKRKHLQQLLNDIRDKKINVVVMWRLDRLVRGVSNTQEVIKVAKENNCELVTAMIDLDYKSASGKYMINMEAAHGEYELDIISERTILGLHRAIKEGHLTKVPFGYMRDLEGPDKKKVIINPKTAPIVKRMFELYLNGASCQEISDTLTKEYPTLEEPLKRHTIETMLQNETYAGMYRLNKRAEENGTGVSELLEDVVEPIIDRETMQFVKRRNSENKLHLKRKKTYLFMRKIKCPNCNKDVLGGSYSIGRHGGIYKYYQCNRCRTTGLIPERKIEEAFIKEIDYIIDYFLIADFGTIPIREKPYMVGDGAEVEKSLDSIKWKEDRIKQAFYSGMIEFDEFEREMTTIKARIKVLEKEMNKQTRDHVRIPNDMNISIYATLSEIEKRKSMSYNSRTENRWDMLTEEEKQKIIDEYIESVEVSICDDDGEKSVEIENIKIREKKIDNFAYMFRQDMMDMTIKKEDRNILISKPLKQREIKDFVKEISRFYNIQVYESELKDFNEINSSKVVKIIPISKSRTNKEQSYTIISV